MTWQTFQHDAMATEFAIMIAGQSADYARQAAAAAWRELDRLESELSRYVESSDIARANRLARGETTTIGDDALRCLLIAAEVSESTRRAFEPAYASTRGADQDAQAALFALDPVAHALTSLTERLHLDLGAVGKGYALDVMADVLAEWEIHAACLQTGGSTAFALEPPPGETGWPVGLGEGATHRVVALARRALSGSGLAVKGEHLINPRTGVAAKRRERAWAFAPSGAIADALSTAFFVMPDTEVAEYCAASPAIGAVLTRADGTLVGYGVVPADFTNATSTNPGRRPT
jgi:thiamine biosynthesis lipoprotein